MPGSRPTPSRALVDALERATVFDAPGDAVGKAVRRLLPFGPVKDALSGTWLGHPVHPPLTDVVIGSWTSSFLLDLAGGTSSRLASDFLLGAGIVAALPTAAAGASDWAELGGGTRRVGIVHAVGNSTALTLQILSLRARRRGERTKGVGLSALAMGLAAFSAWLGGHLSFGRGVGVNQTAFEEFPKDWTPLLGEADLTDPVARSGVLLVRD